MENENLYTLIKNYDFFHDAMIESLTIRKTPHMISDIEIILVLQNKDRIQILCYNVHTFNFSVKENYVFSLIHEVRISHIGDDFYLSFSPEDCDFKGNIRNDENYLFCEKMEIKELNN
jgi:hypothetical protein